MKNHILFLLHIPPPIHGSSVVGMAIKESALINNHFKCEFINLLASKNVAESGIVNFKKILNFVIIGIRILGSITRKRPDLCYLAITTTGKAFFRDLLIVALLKSCRIKCIYHLHNKGVSRHQNNAIYRTCYNFVFRNAEVILLSRHLYPDIQAFVPVAKIHICPNGIPDQFSTDKIQVPLQKTNNAAKKKEYNSKKNIQILFLSNLIKSKGIFNLLEAFELLKKRSIKFEAVFIGGEGDVTASQFNEQIRQKGLNQLVYYQGKKYREEKRIFFLKADIFAFPTYSECFPLVLLEAMSYFLPVVTTNEGGIPDIVEDGVTGILLTENNVEALAHNLEKLIQDAGLRQQMGAAGRKKYEQEFTLEIFENRLARILTHLIEK